MQAIDRAWRTALVGYAALVCVAAVSLPDRVPVHFDGSGGADRWGSRWEALVAFAAVGALVWAAFDGSALLIRRIGIEWLNLPHKRWWTETPDREATARARIAEDLHLLGLLTMLLLIAVLSSQILVAADPEPALPRWTWLVIGVYFLASLGWCVWMLVGRYRPARPDSAAPPSG